MQQPIPRIEPTSKRLSILGATGSIGKNTLDVVRHLGGQERFQIVALSGRGNCQLLAEQAREFRPEIVVTADPKQYQALKDLMAGTGIEVAAGPDALVEIGDRPTDMVMAGIVGIAGLAPTLAAARNGADIALANKECLVSAGNLFKDVITKGGGKLLPVDSEHNAIFQVLERDQKEAVERVILTASGGPFRDWPVEQMANVKPETAAAHPNWAMGQKISIDSASLFNKALEMVEAMHLFDLRPDQIEVIVHPESVIHSMVGYRDGSVLAQLGAPDMRTAIGYALTHPERSDLPIERLDFAKLATLNFEAPDPERFPSLRLARLAMERGGVQGAVLNGAKEAALDAFIAHEIGFLEMAEIVEATMDHMLGFGDAGNIEEIFAADAESRWFAAAMISGKGAK